MATSSPATCEAISVNACFAFLPFCSEAMSGLESRIRDTQSVPSWRIQRLAMRSHRRLNITGENLVNGCGGIGWQQGNAFLDGTARRHASV